MTAITEFDHSVIAVNDIILAQRFYNDVLGEIFGCELNVPTLMNTEEILRQVHNRERMVERERTRSDGSGQPRVRVSAPHAGVKVGMAVIPMFLYTEHVQEPPPEQLKGTPRLAMHVDVQLMEKAVEVFRHHRVPFEGPVDHRPPSPIAHSIYFKDPSSNFLELACPRE